MTEKPRNAMQAVLDRAAQAGTAAHARAAPSHPPKPTERTAAAIEPHPSNGPRARTPG